MNGVIIASISSGSVALMLSTLLILASKFFHTETDEKVEQIIDVLPGANCGACKKAGCAQLASSIIKGEASVDGCPVGGAAVSKAIAKIMGVEPPAQKEKTRAFIFCHGYEDIALSHKKYIGIQKCSAAHLIGGNKDCSYGCVGFLDCMNACPFDAIQKSDSGIPQIIEERCTSCGACVRACPRRLIEIHPTAQQFHIYCKSHDKGAVAKKHCQKACIACGICVKKASGGIEMDSFLAKIDYTDYSLNEDNTKGCPSGALTSEHINVSKNFL